MPTLATLKIAAIAFSLTALPLSAQWPEVKTKRVPLTRDGKPNLTAPAPKTAGGKTPDFSGIWISAKAPCEGTSSATFGCNDAPEGIPIGFIDVTATRVEEVDRGSKEGLPYQPWAAALAKQRMAGQGKDSPTPRCLPMPSIAHWNSFHPQKLVQTDEALIILDEYMDQYRQIFLDGRPLPKDPYPYFKGYSVAHWESDTLVVDTMGFKDGIWLDGKGNPLTDQARTVERIRRPNYGNLEVQITVNDPKAYTRPWTVTRSLKIAVDTELFEYICNENEKDVAHMAGK
jgi:hypothetical protein